MSTQSQTISKRGTPLQYWRKPDAVEVVAQSTPKFRFTRLVDTLTPIPQGRGAFQTFGLGHPAIHWGRVAFWAAGEAGQVGLYQAEDQTLKVLVNTTQTLPNQSHRFAGFGSTPVFDQENVLFLGQDQVGCLRLYRKAHDQLLPLVETNCVTGKDDDYFINLSHPAARAGRLTFLARMASDHRKGIFQHSQGALQTVALAGKSALLDLSIPAVDQAGRIVFRGENDRYQPGIYLYHHQQIRVLASTTTSIPEGMGTFRTFGDPLIDRGRVFFQGSGSVFQQGIYCRDSTGLHKVVDSQTRVPNSLEVFSKFQSLAVSGEQIAFLAQDSCDRTSLFLAMPGTLTKVIEVGDRLTGKPIVGLSMGRFALHRQTIAFRARFVDGTEGIFIAEPQKDP